MPGTLEFSPDNAPDEFTRVFNSLPRVVQNAFRWAYQNGLSMNDMFFAMNDAVRELREASPEAVANAVGQALGGAAYIATDTGGPATRAGLGMAATAGGAIANAASSFFTPSPTDREPPTISPQQPRRGPPLPNLQPTTQPTTQPPQTNNHGWNWQAIMSGNKRNADGEPAGEVSMLRAGTAGDSNSSTAATNGGRRSRAIMPMFTSPRMDIACMVERQMVKLPLKIYFSINKLDIRSPVVLKFQLNEYWKIFRDQSFVAQGFSDTTTPVEVSQLSYSGSLTNPAVPGAQVYTDVKQNPALARFITNRSKGISRDKVYDQWGFAEKGMQMRKPLNLNYMEARQFPYTTEAQTAGSNTSTGSGIFGNSIGDLQPDFRNHLERFFTVRHVHGCDWKLTITNPAVTSENRGVVFFKQETQTSALASAAQNLTTDRPLHETRTWPGLGHASIDGGTTVVQGKYRSNTATHDVIDADEIRDWYPTNPINYGTNVYTDVTHTPTYLENCTMMFYADQHAMLNPSFNCQLELDYYVEYKDLRKEWRYINREVPNNVQLGTQSDIWARRFPVVEGTNWPTTKQFTQGEVQELKAYFDHVGQLTH
jgi:hypothetical protein